MRGWRTVRAGGVLLALTTASCSGDQLAAPDTGTADGTVAVAADASSPPASTPTTITERTEPLATDGAGSVAETTTHSEVWDPPAHRIGVGDGDFVERATGAGFVPRGVNYVDFVNGFDRTLDPFRFDADATSAVFAALAERGYNTVRIFLDTCQCASGEDGFRAEYLDTVAAVLQLAADHGLVLVLTSNDLPDIPFGDRANLGADDRIDGYRNAHVLTSYGHDEFVRYWDELLAGLVERQARLDVVLGWSILNEQWLFANAPPLSLVDAEITTAAGTYAMDVDGAKAQMVSDNLLLLIERTVTTIRARDPDALVTMGFFAPRFPNRTEIGAGSWVDTAPLIDSALDFVDFHAYPGGDIDVAQHAQNFGITDAKPVLMGEVGAFRHLYASADRAALAVQEWIADSCAAGWDGWLYWAYQPLPGVSDATWTFTAADGLLLDALAPATQPDPCVPTLVDPNLARSATATASQSLPGEPPEAAIDGNPGTQWGAGDDAPQWIEIELAEPAAVAEIRLHVAQFPNGPTDHRIELLGAAGDVLAAERFVDDTDAGTILTAGFAPAIEAVTAVRVTTEASVSWVAWTDIEIIGP